MAVELARTAGSMRYGLVAQACSSATNFGLVVVAGHALGPSGVGTLFVGFLAYLVLLGFQRSLVTDPLVVGSSKRNPSERAARSRFALTLTLTAALPAAGLVAAIGVAAPEEFGRGMLLFAPWLVPALIQDLGRSIVFRDRTGRATAYSDAAWLLGMAAAVPLALGTDSDWAVVGCWGAGAICGSVVTMVQIRWRPAPFRESIVWWKSEAWPFGRWLGMGGALYNVASYFSVLALVGILGAREFGGLRAVQTVFAPLTLLGPALSLPGLPLLSRTAGESPRRAMMMTLRFGALMALLTGVYVLVFYGFPGSLGFFFGEEFVEFRSILLPIGISQILLAPAFALTMFLKAQQRGRSLFWSVSLYTLFNVTLAVALALLFGLNGAAWAQVAAALLYIAALVAVIRPRSVVAAPGVGSSGTPDDLGPGDAERPASHQ